MKTGLTVDTSDFETAIRAIEMDAGDMLNIEGAGAKIIINTQRLLVPVDTAATKTSINSHIVKASKEQVIDDIGPETDYAPVIEYGRRDMPNYPIQPFIRPSVFGDQITKVRKVISTAFGLLVISRWP